MASSSHLSISRIFLTLFICRTLYKLDSHTKTQPSNHAQLLQTRLCSKAQFKVSYEFTLRSQINQTFFIRRRSRHRVRSFPAAVSYLRIIYRRLVENPSGTTVDRIVGSSEPNPVFGQPPCSRTRYNTALSFALFSGCKPVGTLSWRLQESNSCNIIWPLESIYYLSHRLNARTLSVYYYLGCCDEVQATGVTATESMT